jgi:hypothetical protein
MQRDDQRESDLAEELFMPHQSRRPMRPATSSAELEAWLDFVKLSI